jgi:hypothetical protein
MGWSSSPSAARFTWLSRLVIACFLGCAVLLTFLSLEGFPTTLADHNLWPYLADQPIGDDGYYMMTVAWNIGGGEGISYNFGQPTTGIQPLATFVFAGSRPWCGCWVATASPSPGRSSPPAH